MWSLLFSLMSFLADVFTPMFTSVRLGRYLLSDFGDYLAYMRTCSTVEDPFKWREFLEILAASIMYNRPIHVHVTYGYETRAYHLL